MAKANRFQPQQMVDLLERIAGLEGQLHGLRENLRAHWCTHLLETGFSAIRGGGTSFSPCEICGERIETL
jgi:hypothetical protein